MRYTTLIGIVVVLFSTLAAAEVRAQGAPPVRPSTQKPTPVRPSPAPPRQKPASPSPAPKVPPRLACTATGPGMAVMNEAATFKGQIEWLTEGSNQPPPAVTYDWDFGDGSDHSTTIEATHTYTKPGWYSWSLTITPASGEACRRTWLVAAATVGPDVATRLTRSSVLDVVRGVTTPTSLKVNMNLVDAATAAAPLTVSVGEKGVTYLISTPRLSMFGTSSGGLTLRTIEGHAVHPKGVSASITGATPDAVQDLKGSVSIDGATFSCDPDGCQVTDGTTGVDDLVGRLSERDLADAALRHTLPSARLAAAKKVTDQAILAQLAEKDASPRVRLEASKNVTAPEVLARLASESPDRDVKLQVIPRVTDQTALGRAAGSDADEKVRMTAVARLTDQSLLSAIAANASDVKVRVEAAKKVTDQSTLVSLALEDRNPEVRAAAASSITDEAAATRVLSTSSDPAVRRKTVSRVERTILERLSSQDSDLVVRYLASTRLGTVDAKSGPFNVTFVDAVGDDFQIGRTEVTQAQWKAAMDSNPSHFPGDDRPVEKVSWNDTQKFLAVLNGLGDGWQYALPTEAQWNAAARAGSADEFPSGPTKKDLKLFAWHKQNSNKGTREVGRLKPNAWGLHDVAGNVAEWLQDPDKDKGRRIVRGCTWSDDDDRCNLSVRSTRTPETSETAIGFRIVRTRVGEQTVTQ